MRLAEVIVLIDSGGYGDSAVCERALGEIRAAIEDVVWPPGNDRFVLYPESGKKKGEGNGVVPVKVAFITALKERGWKAEQPFPLRAPAGGAQFGAMDAAKDFDGETWLVEWETGNISSSHRTLNKMGMGLVAGLVTAAVLVVPTRKMARYFTDRIGNLPELLPYLSTWRTLVVPRGYLAIFAVEQDDESWDVPRITKGTDGRALL